MTETTSLGGGGGGGGGGASRKLFRDAEPARPAPTNIMNDRRVVRGSNYAAPVVTTVRVAADSASFFERKTVFVWKDGHWPPKRHTSKQRILCIAFPVPLQTVAADIERRAKAEEERMRRRLQESRRAALAESARRAGTPEPVDGRLHATVQTEVFLEVRASAATVRKPLVSHTSGMVDVTLN